MTDFIFPTYSRYSPCLDSSYVAAWNVAAMDRKDWYSFPVLRERCIRKTDLNKGFRQVSCGCYRTAEFEHQRCLIFEQLLSDASLRVILDALLSFECWLRRSDKNSPPVSVFIFHHIAKSSEVPRHHGQNLGANRTRVWGQYSRHLFEAYLQEVYHEVCILSSQYKPGM